MSIELDFPEVARRVRQMYGEQRLSHAEIAQRLDAEGIAPMLGHQFWSWRLTDAILVLSASARHAIEARGEHGQSESP